MTSQISTYIGKSLSLFAYKKAIKFPSVIDLVFPLLEASNYDSVISAYITFFILSFLRRNDNFYPHPTYL